MKKRRGSKPERSFLWWGLRLSFFGMLGLIAILFVFLAFAGPLVFVVYSSSISITKNFSLFLLVAMLTLIPLLAVSSVVLSVINLIRKKEILA